MMFVFLALSCVAAFYLGRILGFKDAYKIIVHEKKKSLEKVGDKINLALRDYLKQEIDALEKEL